MAKLKKTIQKQNLDLYQTWIVDNDPSSRYFRLNQLPDVLTAGKNAFLINGSPELEPTTEVKIEILDSAGNPLFIQPIRNYAEGLARVISVEVYEDTPAGPATLTILGHLRYDATGTLPPDEFAKAYNVKWSKQILIAPSKPNVSPIRLYEIPTLSVSEVLVPFLSSSTPAPTTVAAGSVTLSSILTTPGVETSRITTLSRVGTSLSLTTVMQGGLFMATVNGAPYTASIAKVVNKGTAQLSVAFPSSSSSPVTVASSQIVYTPEPTFALTPETRSYANVTLDNLTTFSGEIHRVKLYGRSIDQKGDYQIIGDFRLTPPELTVTQSVSMGEPIIRIGEIKSQTVIGNYWNSGTASDNEYAVNGTIPVQYHTDVINDAMRINDGRLWGASSTPKFFIGSKDAFTFVEDHEYEVQANIACVTNGTYDARMDVYLFGSAFPSSTASPLGVLVTSLTLRAGETRRDFGTVVANLIAGKSGTAYVRFVMYAGDWSVGNIKVAQSYETGFNADDAKALLPVYGRRLESLQFKAELYDANSNLVPVNVESPVVFFDGGNFTFRGTDNRVAGDLKVGAEGQGIVITAGGYTGSGGPVPNSPAMYIGQGTWGNPNTPFLVASSSNGSLFSLGDQLKWDGTTLQVAGEISLSPDQEARIGRLESSASNAAITGSTTSTTASLAYTSASTLDSRIFTDSSGRITRPPTGSAAGLYLGNSYLGFYSASMWRTYMSNLGHFFLTGSSGTDNYLAWDGSALRIAGDITITAGSTLVQINDATTTANNASTAASDATTTANNASASSAGALASASNASASAANSLNVANAASSTASAASASAANASATASAASASVVSVDAKVFTDSSGQIVKTPVSSSPGLYLGRTHLGYYSASAWRTYMSDTGNFFLTSSGNNFLSWDAGNLTIAGNITLLAGPTSASLSDAHASASRGITSASTAITSASQASASAATAHTTASHALTTASVASSSAATANTSASALDTKIFTDSTGRIVKTPSTASSGLFLGATAMGYYDGVRWKTYMSNTGMFYLTGSLSNYLLWDGNTLTITGNINIVGGQSATDISNAQSTANSANTAASTAQSTANQATASAATANTSASQASASAAVAQTSASIAQTSASQASASAAKALVSASNIDAKVFTDSTGKLVKTPSPTGKGLFIGSNFLGYYSGSAWKTYMSDTGNFYLTGSVGSSNYLTWDGNNLRIAGAIEVLSGNTYNAIIDAQSTANQATASAAIANTSASQASASAAAVNSKVFTDTTGRIVSAPNPSTAGLYLGNSYLGYYAGGAWKTYMSNTGNFYLSGAGTNGLTWDGTELNITGNITITGGSNAWGVSTGTGQNLMTTVKDWVVTPAPMNTPPVNFTLNGAASENAIQLGITPYGDTGKLWVCIPTGDGSGDGGWNTTTMYIDPTKTYRYVVWVKRTGGATANNETTYHGVGGSSVADISTGTTNGNPYFWSGDLPNSSGNMNNASDWFLMVGYVFPHNYGTTQRNVSGVWSKDTGEKVLSGTDFKWLTSTTTTSWRSYFYYATNASLRQYFYSPMVHVVDGTEPSIDQLLSVGTVAVALANDYSSSLASRITSVSASTATTINGVDAKVFTDSNGKLAKTPSTSTAGLYLGQTYMGYFNGSAWKTYMSNTGNFYLSGTGANGLSWDGTTLSINGNITITGGNGATTSYVDSSATSSRTQAINAAATDATQKADAVGNKVVTDTSNKIVKNTTWNGAGLYLGADYMGYRTGSGVDDWATYIGSNGTFRFFKDVNNQIGWDNTTFFVKTQQLLVSATNLNIDSVNQVIKLGTVAQGGSTGVTLQGNGKIIGSTPSGSQSFVFDPLLRYAPLRVHGGIMVDTLYSSVPYSTNPFTIPTIQFGYKSSDLASWPSGESIGVQTITFELHNGNIIAEGRIEANGDIIAYATSDLRLKDNVTPIPNALMKVKRLSGNTFIWNDKSREPGKMDVGVIAQEVAEIVPEAVRTRIPTLETEEVMSVRYEKLIPLLIEGIKELSKEVDDLKAQLRRNE